MIGARYSCGGERRRAAVASPTAPPGLTGIDFLTVDQGPPLTLTVELVKPIASPVGGVTDAMVEILGGVRFAAPSGSVVTAGPAGQVARLIVTFPPDAQTDFSTYTLRLVNGPSDQGPPSWIDPRLAEVDFSFKVDCPSDFDCAPSAPQPAAPGTDPSFNYLARDYQGFRRLLLDRLTALVPGFAGDNQADFTTTLVEALAYAADQASYQLDWVGTEAFLGVARSRTSLRRHARLVDYVINEGASARVFVQFDTTPGVGQAADGLTLPAGVPLLPRTAGLRPTLAADAYRGLLPTQPVVFETTAAVRLWQWRNAIAFYTWGDDLCVLPKGSTSATLIDASSGGPDALAAGDFLLLTETTLSPVTSLAVNARPEFRQIVRLTGVAATPDPLAPALKPVTVTWDKADALGFDLTLQTLAPGAAAGSAGIPSAIARGNIVLADHGLSLPPAAVLGLPNADMAALRPALDPAEPPEDTPWQPMITPPPGVAVAAPSRVQPPPVGGPASAALAVSAQAATPAVALDDDFETWRARADLLSSGPFNRDFVVEVDISGLATLRFGDNILGLAPAPGASLGVTGRFGSGLAGGLGADALAHVVVPDTLKTALLTPTNPLLAEGAADPEPVSAIRANAPEAFWRQDRAVTAEDYATVARQHPEVQDAAATVVWTGGWWTVLVYLDRVGGTAVDAAFRADVAAWLEPYRTMGYDVAVRAAKPAPLDIGLEVCARPGEAPEVVAARVIGALHPLGPDGAPGFFNPDNFRFGTPLYLSQLVAAAMAVPGVSAVRVTRFQRWAQAPRGELSAGVITPVAFEILRLDDDPNFPENGRLTVSIGGGP
jgi:hypothetical protein